MEKYTRKELRHLYSVSRKLDTEMKQASLASRSTNLTGTIDVEISDHSKAIRA
jgi:hypothetical protein